METTLLFKEKECMLPTNIGKREYLPALVSVFVSEEGYSRTILSNSEDEKKLVIQVILSRKNLKMLYTKIQDISTKSIIQTCLNNTFVISVVSRKICSISRKDQFCEFTDKDNTSRKELDEIIQTYRGIISDLFKEEIDALDDNTIKSII